MGHAKRNDQEAKPDPTAWVKLEDESLGTNEAAVAVPLTAGETKTTARWITPIYGQRVVEVPIPGGGKK